MSIDGWITPVRRDQVVQVLFLVKPVPRGHDNVSLHSLWPLRLRMRQLALGDAIGPICEVSNRCAAKLFDELTEHLLARLPGLNAAKPCLFRVGRIDRVRDILRERS